MVDGVCVIQLLSVLAIVLIGCPLPLALYSSPLFLSPPQIVYLSLFFA